MLLTLTFIFWEMNRPICKKSCLQNINWHDIFDVLNRKHDLHEKI